MQKMEGEHVVELCIYNAISIWNFAKLFVVVLARTAKLIVSNLFVFKCIKEDLEPKKWIDLMTRQTWHT